MQNVKITISVLFHPEQDKLKDIHLLLGKLYDQKVLPPLVNEIMRSVVAQYSASQLLSQRDQVSDRIRAALEERAKHFNIIITNVAIRELTFGKEYLAAIESKQVAQQQAERAKYMVEQARESKKSIVIKAEAEAKSIQLVGSSARDNPSYLDIRKIQYAKEISSILSDCKSTVMLNTGIILKPFDTAAKKQNLKA